MSSSNKFAKGPSRGQSRLGPPQKRGILPLRPGPPLKDRAALGLGKDAVGSGSAGNGGTAVTSQEEAYQLLAAPAETGRRFAMMIRLTPEILDALKQAEAEGNEMPMMKFGANASGHEIKVGHESFKFSSAPEPGDLCHIYEQRSREDGEGILVEAGSVWRKLAVQRFLSASEKDRVKKRTAEAEKKQKLRKSILVDPSTHQMIPQTAHGEVNGRKPLLKTKKEPPPKKRKVTTSPGPEPATGGRGTSSAQTVGMPPPKGRPVAEAVVGPPVNKGNVAVQKEKIQPAVSSVGTEGGGSLKMGSAVNMTELRNNLVTLLKESPKGVTIKAAEKAIAEMMPVNPERKNLEKVLKSIAIYMAPGKYLLNPEVEKGSFMDVTPASSGRIQEASGARTREEDSSAAAIREIIREKDTSEFPSNAELLNVVSCQTTPQYSPVKEVSPPPPDSQLHDSKKATVTSPKQGALDGKAVSSEDSGSSSSSESGSESDSESDTSGSGSGSDSGSGSGSGSGSEGSSSSSGTSMDEDVDIMSDDENENKSDSRSKVKGKEIKSVPPKEDSKVQKEGPIVKDDSESRFGDKRKSSSEEQPSHPVESVRVLEAGGNTLLKSDKKERSKSTVNDDGLSSKNVSVSLEATKTQLEGSPFRAKDNLQKIGRPSNEDSGGKQASVKQHSGAEMKRTFADTREKYGKDAEKQDTEKKASERMAKGNGPEDLVKFSHRATKNPEVNMRLHEEGGLVVRTPDQVLKGARLEQSGVLERDEDIPTKERVPERNKAKPIKPGETSGRHIKDLESQQRQQKDASIHGGASKVNASRFTKDFDQSRGYDRDVLQVGRSSKEPTKVPRPSRQTDEHQTSAVSERVGLMVEQAERPIREVDSTRRGKDSSGKDVVKEAEAVGRPPVNGTAPSILSKEGKRMETIHTDSGRSSQSGYAHARSSVYGGGGDRMGSQDLELGELREPSFDDEAHESRKALSRSEEIRSKQALEGSSMTLSKKGNISPDIEKSQTLGKSFLELTKRSPVKVGNGPGRSSQDSRNGKRRLEDNESSETERHTRKKVAATQVREPQHVKQDKLVTCSIKEEGVEKLRSSMCDLQDHLVGSSKNVIAENTRKQPTKEVVDNEVATLKKQKIYNASIAINEKHRDNSKADLFLGSAKKQTPQSSEINGVDFFASYEKKEPELRGPINSFKQYDEYRKEFKEKYQVYVSLNAALENDKADFECLRKQIEQAKCKDDKNKLASIYEKVRKDYLQCHKRYKRMVRTFRLLFEELRVIKQQCKDYAEKVGQG